MSGTGDSFKPDQIITPVYSGEKEILSLQLPVILLCFLTIRQKQPGRPCASQAERIWSQSEAFLPIWEPDRPVHCGALYSCGFLGLLGVDCDSNWFGVSYFLFLGAFRKKFKSLECAQIRQEIRHQQFHNKGRGREGGGTFTGLFSGWAECESFSFSLVSCVMKNSEESSEEKNNKHIHVFLHIVSAWPYLAKPALSYVWFASSWEDISLHEWKNLLSCRILNNLITWKNLVLIPSFKPPATWQRYHIPVLATSCSVYTGS